VAKVIERKNGRLLIDGCDSEDLARQYGTPLFVVSEGYMEERCRELRESFLNKYENVRAAYAGKAFLPMAMCKFVEEQGLCLDVVSGGELYTAIKAGFPAERIEFNGNNKSRGELEMAVDYGVGRIIVDGVDEPELIEEVCSSLDKEVDVLMRITPGVDSHTHRFITTGGLDSKFGIPMERVEEIFHNLEGCPHVNLLGFHFHVGSQLHDNTSYLLALDVLMELIGRLKEKYGFQTKEINIGGGFGIYYTGEDDAKPYAYFFEPIMNKIEAGFQELGEPRPTVVTEPGRSIVGGAGVTLYTVGTTKEIPGVRKYVSVDGGMTDNIRPALYDSKYECWSSSQREKETVTVCGKCCESGDILLTDVTINKPERGDHLAIFGTGAYCWSMSGNYNKIPSLPVVMTKEGKSRLIVRGQSYEELISREIL
jgi:diaminopimelate decarboxylase